MTIEQITQNGPDGAQMGISTTEKNAFFGATPVAQPASGDQASVTATAVATGDPTIETLTESSGQGSPDTTIADVVDALTAVGGSGMTAGQEAEVNVLFGLCDDNFADLADQQSKARVDLAAHKVELDKLVTDVGNAMTLINQLRSDSVTLGLSKGAA